MTDTKTNFFQRDITVGKVFSDKSKELFYGEFSSLVESGIDIQRSLSILIEEQTNNRILHILESVLTDLVNGLTLSESLRRTGHFTAYEFQSIQIGEETGGLQLILSHLAKYFSNKVKLKRQLTSVFTYPVFVILITIGVLYFMLNSVVPMFEDVFKQFGQELPYLTRTIIDISKVFSTGLIYTIIILFGLGVYGYSQRQEEWYRKLTSSIVIKIPIFGALVKKVYLARMCQSFSLLLSSKTPLVKALKLVEEMIGFFPLENALKEVGEQIRKGESFHSSLSKFPIFDKRLVSLVKIAEEINQLDQAFNRLSDQYQEDVEYKTKLIGTIIEPLIIVVIGLIVGVIMIAMYMPMFNLSNVIK